MATFVTLPEKNTLKIKIVAVALIIYHLFISASCLTMKGPNLSSLTSKMEAWWKHLFVYTYLSSQMAVYYLFGLFLQ